MLKIYVDSGYWPSGYVGSLLDEVSSPTTSFSLTANVEALRFVLAEASLSSASSITTNNTRVVISKKIELGEYIDYNYFENGYYQTRSSRASLTCSGDLAGGGTTVEANGTWYSVFNSSIDVIKTALAQSNSSSQFTISASIVNVKGTDLFAFTNAQLSAQATVTKNLATNCSSFTNISVIAISTREVVADLSTYSSTSIIGDSVAIVSASGTWSSQFTSTAQINYTTVAGMRPRKSITGSTIGLGNITAMDFGFGTSYYPGNANPYPIQAPIGSVDTGNFTFESRFKLLASPNNYNYHYFILEDGANKYIKMVSNTAGNLYIEYNLTNGSSSSISLGTITQSSFNSLRIVRENGTTSFYLNGSNKGSRTNLPSYGNLELKWPGTNIFLPNQTDQLFVGYIDEIRFSNVVRSQQASNFIYDTNTLLLLDFNNNLVAENIPAISQATATIAAIGGYKKTGQAALSSSSSISAVVSRLKGTSVSLSSSSTMSTSGIVIKEASSTVSSSSTISISAKRFRNTDSQVTSQFSQTVTALRIQKSSVALSSQSNQSTTAVKTVKGQAAFTSTFTQTSTISDIRGADLFAFTNAQLAVEVSRIRDNNIDVSSVFTVSSIISRTRYITAEEDSQFSITVSNNRVRYSEAASSAAFSLAVNQDVFRTTGISCDATSQLSATANRLIDVTAALASQVTLTTDATVKPPIRTEAYLESAFTIFVDTYIVPTEFDASISASSQLSASGLRIKSFASDLSSAFSSSINSIKLVNLTSQLTLSSQLSTSQDRLRDNEISITVSTNLTESSSVNRPAVIYTQALFTPNIICSAFVNDNAVLTTSSSLSAQAQVTRELVSALSSSTSQTVTSTKLIDFTSQVTSAFESSVYEDWIKLADIEPIVVQVDQQTSISVTVPFDGDLNYIPTSEMSGGALRGAFFSARMFAPMLFVETSVIVEAYSYTVNDPGPGISNGWFATINSSVDSNVIRRPTANLVSYNSLGLTTGGNLIQTTASLTAQSTQTSSARRTRRAATAITTAFSLSATVRRQRRSSAAIVSSSNITATPRKVKVASLALTSSFTARATPSRYYPRPFGTWTSNIALSTNNTYANWNQLEVNNLLLTPYSGTSSASQTLFSVSGHTLTRSYSVGPTRNYLTMDGTTYDISGITPMTGSTVMKLVATRNSSTILTVGSSNYSFPAWDDILGTPSTDKSTVGSNNFAWNLTFRSFLTTATLPDRYQHTDSAGLKWVNYNIWSDSSGKQIYLQYSSKRGTYFDLGQTKWRVVKALAAGFTTVGTPEFETAWIDNNAYVGYPLGWFATTTGQQSYYAAGLNYNVYVTRTGNSFAVQMEVPQQTSLSNGTQQYAIQTIGSFTQTGSITLTSNTGNITYTKPNTGYIQTGLYQISGAALTNTPTELFITNSNYSTSQQIQASPRRLNDQTGVLGMYHALYGVDDVGVLGRLDAKGITARFTQVTNGNTARLAQATLASTNTITIGAKKSARAQATLTASSQLAATAQKIRVVQANLSSQATQTTQGRYYRAQGRATIQAQAQLSLAPYNFTKAQVSLTAQAQVTAQPLRKKQLQAQLQVQAFEVAIVFRTGKGLIQCDTQATLVCNPIKKTTTTSVLASQFTQITNALPVREGFANLVSTASTSVGPNRLRGITNSLTSQTELTESVRRIASARADFVAFNTQVTIPWYLYTNGVYISARFTLSVTAKKTTGINLNLEAFATTLQLGQKIRYFEAHLTAFNTVFAVGRIFTIDPFYQLKIEQEARYLVVTSETRYLQVESERRLLKVNRESRLLSINSETRVNKIKGYPT